MPRKGSYGEEVPEGRVGTWGKEITSLEALRIKISEERKEKNFIIKLNKGLDENDY